MYFVCNLPLTYVLLTSITHNSLIFTILSCPIISELRSGRNTMSCSGKFLKKGVDKLKLSSWRLKFHETWVSHRCATDFLNCKYPLGSIIMSDKMSCRKFEALRFVIRDLRSPWNLTSFSTTTILTSLNLFCVFTGLLALLMTKTRKLSNTGVKWRIRG